MPRGSDTWTRWTSEEVKTLKRVYPKQGAQCVADILGTRSVRAVYQKAWGFRLGIEGRKPRKPVA